MIRWLLVTACCAMLAAAGPADAQLCQAPTIPHINGVGPFSGKNFVNYDLEVASFPDSETDPATGQTVTGLHNQLDSSLDTATSRWNQACQGPLFNRYPLLMSSNISLPSAGALPIRFQPGLQSVDVKRCPPPDQAYNCYPPAAVQWNGATGEPMALVIYGRYGDSKQGIAHPTLVHFYDRFEEMLTHEIGHTLGLDHNNCPASYMRGDSSLYDGQPKTIGGAECSSLTDSHAPPDPLQQILDENERCRLENYCQLDPRIPWPTLRPYCTWIAITEGGEASNLVRYHYFCLGGGRGIDPPLIPEDVFGPRILIDFPREQEPVTGMLQVRGWAWEASRGLREVKVWLDGAPALLHGFSWGDYAPELCAAGIDPGNCDPYAGFSGWIDTDQLSPGEHTLVVVATGNGSPYPLPGYQLRTFQVTTNMAPVANEDSATMVINGITGVGQPEIIRVTANDFDPEGSDIRLTARTIVAAPSEGIAIRLNDDEILFQPNAWAWQDDSFTYEIEDESGRVAIGVVELRFLWGIMLP